MKTQPQRSADLTLLCALIKQSSLAMMTYLDDEGALVSQPMAPLEMQGDGAIWFLIDLRISRADQLNVVNLSFTDTARDTYVSVSGYGEVDLAQQRVAQLWTSAANRWFPQGLHYSYLAALRVVPDTAQYWDVSSSRMIRLFRQAAPPMASEREQVVEQLPLKSASA